MDLADPLAGEGPGRFHGFFAGAEGHLPAAVLTLVLGLYKVFLTVLVECGGVVIDAFGGVEEFLQAYFNVEQVVAGVFGFPVRHAVVPGLLHRLFHQLLLHWLQ